MISEDGETETGGSKAKEGLPAAKKRNKKATTKEEPKNEAKKASVPPTPTPKSKPKPSAANTERVDPDPRREASSNGDAWVRPAIAVTNVPALPASRVCTGCVELRVCPKKCAPTSICILV